MQRIAVAESSFFSFFLQLAQLKKLSDTYKELIVKLQQQVAASREEQEPRQKTVKDIQLTFQNLTNLCQSE